MDDRGGIARRPVTGFAHDAVQGARQDGEQGSVVTGSGWSPRRNDAETLAAVAEQIRTLRARRGLSLSALAATARIGKGSLSEIEHGARNPTLATLYALAGALGVPLAALLAERPGTLLASDGVTVRLLDAHHLPDGTAVEVYRLHLDPHADRRSPAHGPGVVEHLLVTHGRLRAGRGGAEAAVGPGDELRWVSDVEHSYRALDGRSADGVLVIRTPPGAHDPANAPGPAA